MNSEEAAAFEWVRRCWAEVLGAPADADVTWEEAGGDSLATLHLLLALEKGLGRKLSFDQIEPGMTAAHLAAAVARANGATAAPPVGAGEVVPTVFLFPGVFGDEPRLADFRRSFADRLRFEVIAHPDIDAPKALLADMVQTATVAFRAIQERQPHGPLLLAGYSFGGCVAFEAARQLHAAGRHIGGLTLLDSTAHSLPAPPGRRRMDMLCALGAFDGTRPLLMAAIRRWRPQRAFGARRRLLLHWRRQALRRWQPEPLRSGSALLAVSAGCSNLVIEAWQRLCPDIVVLRLPATHHTLFQPPSLELLCPVFEDAARQTVRAR